MSFSSNRQKASEKYAEQAMFTLSLLTVSDTPGKARTIWFGALKTRWDNFTKYKQMAIKKGYLSIIRGSRLHSDAVGKSEQWLWHNNHPKCEITDKRLLKIIAKEKADLTRWKSITKDFAHKVSGGIKEEREVMYTEDFTKSPAVDYLNNEFQNLKQDQWGRVYMSLETGTFITATEKHSRKSLLEDKWQEPVTTFDMQSAFTNILAHMWLTDSNNSNLAVECRKILRRDLRQDIMAITGKSLEQTKMDLTMLVSGKSFRDIASSKDTTQKALKTLYPLFQEKLTERFRKPFRGSQKPQEQSLDRQATEFETKLWRHPEGIENRFLDLCQLAQVEPKFMDLHDGVLVVQSQRDLMWQAITEVCQEIGYPRELIKEKS